MVPGFIGEKAKGRDRTFSGSEGAFRDMGDGPFCHIFRDASASLNKKEILKLFYGTLSRQARTISIK